MERPKINILPCNSSTPAAAAIVFMCATLTGCGNSAVNKDMNASAGLVPTDESAPSNTTRAVSQRGTRSLPKGGGIYKVGAPYQVGGQMWVPREQPHYDQVGLASWYGKNFHGAPTANGELYDAHALTGAHKTLPMPSYAIVTNLENGRKILIRINDRGPFKPGRIVDLSDRAAQELGFRHKGLVKVRVKYAGPAPLNGDDRREGSFLKRQAFSQRAEN